MDVLNVERDYTRPLGHPEAAVVRLTGEPTTERVDSKPRVPRRRSSWGIKRLVAFVLPVLIAGIAIYHPFGDAPIDFPIWFDYAFITLTVAAAFGTYKLYRKMSPQGLVQPALMVLVAGAILAGVLYGAYLLLGFIDSTGVLRSGWGLIMARFIGAGFVVVAIVATLKLYGWYTRRFENREAREISLRGQALPILIGLVTGVLLAGTPYLISWGFGDLTVISDPDAFSISWDGFISIIASSGIREGVLIVFVFGVIFFRRTQSALGSYIALGLTAIIVGLASLVIPNIFNLPEFYSYFGTWYVVLAVSIVLPIVGLVVVPGILLGTVYLATNNLWMAAALYVLFRIASALFLVNGIFPGGTPLFYILHIVVPLIIAIPFLIYAIKKGHIVRPRLLTSLRR